MAVPLPGRNMVGLGNVTRVCCFCVCACQATSVVSDSVWPYGLQPARILCPWDSPGKSTGVGCHALLQGIFMTQGLNLCLLCLLDLQVSPWPVMPLSIYITCSLSSVDEHLHCFCILAIVNNATINIRVHLSFLITFCFLQINTQEWFWWSIW